MSDRIVIEASNLFDAEESANEEACYRAGTLAFLKSDQIENCDDGEHRCPYCPWRDPIKTPSDGDIFRLPNGKRIELAYVNMRHTKEPQLEYVFIDWKRGWGGRKSYIRKLADWPKVIAGATVLQHGAKPSRFIIAGEEALLEKKQIAFSIANPRML